MPYSTEDCKVRSTTVAGSWRRNETKGPGKREAMYTKSKLVEFIQ